MLECISHKGPSRVDDILFDIKTLHTKQQHFEQELGCFADAVRRDLSSHRSKLTQYDSLIMQMRSELASLRDKVSSQPAETNNVAKAHRTLSRETEETQETPAKYTQSQAATSASSEVSTTSITVPAAPQELEQLRQHVDSAFSNIKEEIMSLRSFVEQSAVKTGFLALAASECKPNEKQVLFNRLREKQMASGGKCGGSAMDSMFAVQGNSTTSGNSASTFMMGHTKIESLGLITNEPGQEFKVNLADSKTERLGLVISERQDGTVIIKEVHNGPVMEWNTVHPWSTMRPGDTILMVNDKSPATFTVANDIKMQPGGLQLLMRRGTFLG